MPRPSMMPPAAITGRPPMASTICGTSASVPIMPCVEHRREARPLPARFAPLRDDAVDPAAARARLASSTVVAVPSSKRAPRALIASIAALPEHRR